MLSILFPEESHKTRPARNREEQNQRAVALLPYVEGVSQSLRRCFQEHGIRTIFKLETTLRKHLIFANDSVPQGKQDGVVYMIPCSDCDSICIGETGRAIQEKINEHERDVRLAGIETSAVSKHTNKTGHSHDWEKHQVSRQGFSMVFTESFKEAIQIKLNLNNFNKNSGIEIPHTWMNTIRKNRERTNHRAGKSANQGTVRSTNHCTNH